MIHLLLSTPFLMSIKSFYKIMICKEVLEYGGAHMTKTVITEYTHFSIAYLALKVKKMLSANVKSYYFQKYSLIFAFIDFHMN